jgi:hypothetical protein
MTKTIAEPSLTNDTTRERTDCYETIVIALALLAALDAAIQPRFENPTAARFAVVNED